MRASTSAPAEHGSATETIEALIARAAARAAEATIEHLRQKPLPQQEWFSQKDSAAYTGYSEGQMADFVKKGIGPKTIKFSHNASRSKREWLDDWCAKGGPSQFRGGK